MARLRTVAAALLLALAACRAAAPSPSPSPTTPTTSAEAPPHAHVLRQPVDPGPALRCRVDADCEFERACGPCGACPGWVPGARNRDWQAASCAAAVRPPDAPPSKCKPCPPLSDPPPEQPTGVHCGSGKCGAVFPILYRNTTPPAVGG